MVAFGNRQKEGLDYDETPVVKMTTVPFFLTVAAHWEVNQMDVHNAFHHGYLAEEMKLQHKHTPSGIYLSQRKYALDIISECALLGGRPLATPIEQNHKLIVEDGDNDPEQYRRLVGRLVYLTYTRPELSYVVHILAHQQPRMWEAATRVVRYLKSCPGVLQGILLSSDSDLQLSGHCDSDWTACSTSRRSLSGFVVMLGNSPIAWKTKKQPTVSCSSAEYRAMGFAT